MRRSVVVIAVATMTACSSSSYTPPPPVTLAKPPTRPNVVSVGGTTRWFAMKHVYLGLVIRDSDKLSADAWKAFGFDIDDRDTTPDDSKTGTNTCQRISGAPTGILFDGDNGRDNNFGAHFMQTVKSLKSDVEAAANKGITKGDATILLRVDNVGPDDNAGVPGAFFVARSLGALPTWTDADHFPIASSSLVDGADIRRPIVTFPAGYMAGGTWVSGPMERTTAKIDFSLFGSEFGLRVDALRLAVDLTTGAATLAGFTKVTTLKDSLASGVPSLGLCPGNATFDQVVTTITQSADLVAEAPGFQEESATCDAISIGMGLVMAPTGEPTVVVPADDPATPCK